MLGPQWHPSQCLWSHPPKRWILSVLIHTQCYVSVAQKIRRWEFPVGKEAKLNQMAQMPPTICKNLYLVHDFVDIDAAGVGELAIVTVTASVQQHPVVLTMRHRYFMVLYNKYTANNLQHLLCVVIRHINLVLLGVEHVVALLAKPDPHKSRTFSRWLCHPLSQCLCKQSVYKCSCEVRWLAIQSQCQLSSDFCSNPSLAQSSFAISFLSILKSDASINMFSYFLKIIWTYACISTGANSYHSRKRRKLKCLSQKELEDTHCVTQGSLRKCIQAVEAWSYHVLAFASAA